jgi:hypothetical protein
MARVTPITSADQVITKLCKVKSLKDCKIYKETAKTVRLDIPENNAQMRTKMTFAVIAEFPGSEITVQRPNDVKIPGGYTVLVKPAKGAKKTASGAYYGVLSTIDLSKFDTSAFADVCSTFSGGTLVSAIKEASDVKCVTDFNKAIEPMLDAQFKGLTLRIHGFTFSGVIGMVPVTNGEPKADVVLVCRKGNKLYPDCYMSYKMGTDAKGFQNYSGLSEKSSPYIFQHKETIKFYTTLAALSQAGKKEEVFQVIKDNKIIGMSVFGMDYGKNSYGINNCHFIAQGEVSLSKTSLSYSHSHKNGDMTFDINYQPVFGARYASGRNNKGPNGLNNQNFRIGIFPRAYRSAWLR